MNFLTGPAYVTAVTRGLSPQRALTGAAESLSASTASRTTRLCTNLWLVSSGCVFIVEGEILFFLRITLLVNGAFVRYKWKQREALAVWTGDNVCLWVTLDNYVKNKKGKCFNGWLFVMNVPSFIKFVWLQCHIPGPAVRMSPNITLMKGHVRLKLLSPNC